MSTFEVVFEPESTLKLLADLSINLGDQWRFNLNAEEKDSIEHLLQALLSDWIDFAFIVSPSVFTIFADHDEFITFYTSDERTIRIVLDLQNAGFESIENYKRPLRIWDRLQDRNL